MNSHEGLIASLKEDGKAEVIIGPDNAGVPGASPQVNRCVCHCATDGSTLMVEALNRAGANVGDLVSVSYDASGLAKNAAVLLGIPGASSMAGILMAMVLFHFFVFPMIGAIAVAAGFFLAGIALGVRIYRAVSSDSMLVIDHIIQTRMEAASGDDKNAFCIGADCRSCHTKA